MANTTVIGAKAIHGQNPQVGVVLLCPALLTSLAPTVPSGDRHSQSHL
jgi:hypothetical protein